MRYGIFHFLLFLFVSPSFPQEKIQTKQSAIPPQKAELKEKTTAELQSVKTLTLQQKAELAERYYRQGIVAYIQGNDRLALQFFKKTLELQPNHPLAKTRMEKLQQETDENKIKKAKEKYNEGLSLYIDGKLEKAKTLWEEALSLDPYNPKLQKALDRIQLELREKRIP